MSSRLTTWARAAALMLALCGRVSVASAHAPQARGAALTPDGSKAAIIMPGFGMLFRAQASQPFTYVCDALLNVQPTDRVASLAYLSDGSLLLGSLNGVRILMPDGCRAVGSTSELGDALVVALAAHSGDTQVVYAVAISADKSGVWRSDDGAQSWTFRSPLVAAELVTALLIDAANPNEIYLSESTSAGHSSLSVSMDGGLTFSAFDQDRALTLLHLATGAAKRHWAVVRSLDNTTNRGFDIQRANTLAGSFQTVLRVNYFGGFAIGPDASIWVGDEGGGVYRSTDGGDSFTNVAPSVATACLAYAGNALWACTPGTNQQPALAKLDHTESSFAGVVAFSEVKQQVECQPQLDVRRRCASAWTEWQNDVLMNGLSTPDAGLTTSLDSGAANAPADVAGALANVDAGAVRALDAGSQVDVPAPRAASHGDCTVRARAGIPGASTSAWSWLACVLLFAMRAGRRV